MSSQIMSEINYFDLGFELSNETCMRKHRYNHEVVLCGHRGGTSGQNPSTFEED